MFTASGFEKVSHSCRTKSVDRRSLDKSLPTCMFGTRALFLNWSGICESRLDEELVKVLREFHAVRTLEFHSHL